ncbi:MAG: hypothetical protein R8K46_05910 [Mariprofundaceae bacterium]
MSNPRSNTRAITLGKTCIHAMLVCMALAMLPASAAAKKVYSPIVEKGELEIAYFLDYSFDGNPARDNASKHQFELEYSFTDRWKTALYGEFSRKSGQDFRYEALKWENIYQLFGEGERWLDAGLYLEYVIPEGSSSKPDVLEFKLLLEKPIETLTHTANITLKKGLGVNASTNTTVGYAWRSKKTWLKHISPAIELYGSLGEVGNTKSLSQQSHQLGPVVFGDMYGGLGYEIGYLVGLTSGSDDGMLKLILKYKF